MRPDVLLMMYCAAIAAASLLGGWLPLRLAVSHTRMQMLMSFLGGMMMGVAVLHLLPHAILRANSVDGPALAMLVGLIGMLLLMRCLHFHQHDLPAETGESHAHGPDCQHNLPAPILDDIGMPDSPFELLPVVSHDHDHDHSHVHDHNHSHDHDHDHDSDRQHGGHRHDSHGHQHDAGSGSHPYAWVGLFLGLALHALLDGVALAASVKAEAHDNPGIMLVGIATFLAIALHKPLDSLSLISLMTFGRWQSGTTVGVNLLYAFITPLGAIATWYGIQQFSLLQPELLGWTLGLSAGVFLCIALVDVVPEIQFHSHDRMKLSLLLLCGVLVAWLIGLVEPGHDHSSSHNHGHTIQSR